MSNKIFDKIDGFIVNNRETLSLLARNLTIVFALCLALQIFGLVSVNQYLNLNWLAFGVFSIDTIALIYYFRTLHKLDIQMFEQRHKILNEFFKYGFLVLLGFVAITQFFKFEWAKEYNVILTILAVFFGVITFYQNKEVIEQVEEEANQEQIEEEKRKQEFPSKFPRISKVPVFKSLIKWMYKEGWWYSLFLVTLILVSLSLKLWNLGKLGLQWDEFYTYATLKSISDYGTTNLPSGFFYLRGIVYHYLVSIITIPLGINEFSMRLFSVFCSIMTILGIYLVGKNILDKKIALLSALILSFSPLNFEYSRIARFYPFLQMAIIFMFLYLIKINNVTFKKYFFVLLIYCSLLLIHLETILILPFIIFYLFYLHIINKSYFHFKFNGAIAMILILLLIVTFGYYLLERNLETNELRESETFPSNKSEFDFLSERVVKIFNINFEILHFYNPLYFNLVFISLVLIIILSFLYNKFITISIFILTTSLFYDIIRTSKTGARLYLFLEPFVILVVLCILYLYLNKVLKIRYIVLKVSVIILFVIPGLMAIQNIINLDYGSKTSEFYPTQVYNKIPDFKEPFIFVKNQSYFSSNDTIVVQHTLSTYTYLQMKPTYWLWESRNLEDYSYKINNAYYDINTGVKIINGQELRRIIKDNEGPIWIITSPSVSINIHTSQNTINFLKDNPNKKFYSKNTDSFVIYYAPKVN